MELFTTIKTIEHYKKLGFDVDYLSSNTYDIMIYKLFDNIPKSKQGFYDLVFYDKKRNYKIGVEIKYNLSLPLFYTALGQCLMRLAHFKNSVNEAVISFSFVKKSDLNRYITAIQENRIPITLLHIPLTDEQTDYYYWYKLAVEKQSKNKEVKNS